MYDTLVPGRTGVAGLPRAPTWRKAADECFRPQGSLVGANHVSSPTLRLTNRYVRPSVSLDGAASQIVVVGLH